MDAVRTIAAVAISSTMVDVSPFSTNGASTASLWFLPGRPLAWLMFIVPGWL
jgi:hypothetical protein